MYPRHRHGTFKVQNTVTTLCLTDEGYGYVDTERCQAGDKSQQWLSGADPASVQSVINLQSQQCLENESYGEGYGNLHTAPCNIASSQSWGWAEGSALIENVQTGLCLESNISVSLDTGPLSGKAYAQQCTVSNWQSWVLLNS